MPDEALSLAGVILGCYKKSDCADPEVFAAGTVAVLCRFPLDVARAVCDPGAGLPSRLKWFPALQEIREACEIENAKIKHRLESEMRVRAQFAERERFESMTDTEKRKAYIKRRMAEVNRAMAQSDLEGRPLPPVDIRGMDDGPEKEMLRKRLDGELSTKAKASASTPCAPLSPTALRAIAPELCDLKETGAA